jgi:hypothetical protein
LELRQQPEKSEDPAQIQKQQMKRDEQGDREFERDPIASPPEAEPLPRTCRPKRKDNMVIMERQAGYSSGNNSHSDEASMRMLQPTAKYSSGYRPPSDV